MSKDKVVTAENRPDPAWNVFVTLWGLASLMHLWNQLPWPMPLIQGCGAIATACAALGLIAFPRSSYALGLFLAIDLAYGLYELPGVPNHRLLTLLVDGVLLISFVEARAWRHDTDWIARVWVRFLPAARLLAIVCYGASALAKFNSGFFDPSVSCASTQYMLIAEHILPWIPQSLESQYLAIWGTAIIESVVTVCLIVPRWRTTGALLGTVFHYMLAATPIVRVGDFSTMLFALFVLFLPVDLWTPRTDEQSKASRMGAGDVAVRYRSVGLLCIFVFAMGLLLTNCHHLSWASPVYDQLRWATFFVGGIAWIGNVALRLGHGAERQPEPIALSVPSWATAPVLAFAVLTVISPYAGLKTRTNFTMFSNLRTEGHVANHWFVPQVYLTPWQNDLVEVLSSSCPRLQKFADEEKLVTWWEFSRLARANPDAIVHFRRFGREHVVDRTGDVSELMRAPPWILQKVMIFRPVDQDGACRCDW